jgi:hypothetical protein
LTEAEKASQTLDDIMQAAEKDHINQVVIEEKMELVAAPEPEETKAVEPPNKNFKVDIYSSRNSHPEEETKDNFKEA